MGFKSAILSVLENRFKQYKLMTKSIEADRQNTTKYKDLKGRIGVISAVSGCFCGSCNKVRLTADGFLKLCLQYDVGTDLKTPIRTVQQAKSLKKL